MEIRGLGIIYVPSIFGVSAVRGAKQVDLVVTLMPQNSETDGAALDRTGANALKRNILGVDVPQVILPVAPGRDLSEYIQPEKSAFGRGGMHSKYTTASKVQKAGIRVIIANGERDNILVDLMQNKQNVPHTEFIPNEID